MTRNEVVDEMREVQKDLSALRKSREALLVRIEDMHESRRELFTSWAATQALLNVMVMAIVRCEGLVEDYHRMLDNMELPNNVVRFEKELS